MINAWHIGNYGTHTLKLSRHITGLVCWKMVRSDPDYVAYFMGTLVGKSNHLEEAKEMVETAARKEIATATSRLNTK